MGSCRIKAHVRVRKRKKKVKSWGQRLNRTDPEKALVLIDLPSMERFRDKS